MGRELSRHPQARSPCAADCGLCHTASFLHARRLSEQQATPSGSSSLAGSPVARQRSLRGLHTTGSSASLGGSSSAALAAGSEPASPAVRHSIAGGGSSGALHLLRATSSHFLQPAAQAAERHGDGEWRSLEGEFCSVMLVCMPCRSDKTRAGMARYGHLADGRMKLVLVQRCSPLQVGGAAPA